MKLSTKIILSVILLLAVSLCVSGMISVVRERSLLENVSRAQGKAISKVIACVCIEPLLSEDYRALNAFVATTGKELNDILSIEIIRKNSTVSKYFSPNENSGIKRSFVTDIIFHPQPSDKPVKLGVVHLKLSDRTSQGIVTARINELLVDTCLIFVFLGISLSFLLRKIVLQKIMDLDFMAREFSEGRLTSRVNLSPDDELGELAGTMGIMAEKILSSQQAIERQNEELKKANAAKNEFLANMSHEIRTPMNGIMGVTDLLLNSKLTTRQRKFLEMSKKSTGRLLSVVNDILDFSKIEAGKFALENRDFNLRLVLDDVLHSSKIQAEDKGLFLEWQIEPGVPESLSGDPNRLMQVVINLISNAIKFTQEGGITFKVMVKEQTEAAIVLYFTVTDTGIGVPSEKQEMIFKSFSQGDASYTREFGGTGLGLAICAKLLAIMGGKIGLESVAGKGSTFWFTVSFLNPKYSGMNKNAAETPAVNNLSPGQDQECLQGLNILLVEDDVINRSLCQTLMAEKKIHVAIAKNGSEAVEAAQDVAFDLVLMDIQMPAMSGFEATKKIRALERENGRQPVPIIAITAHATEGYEKRCLDAGMNDYLTKPMRADDLYAAIKRQLIQKLKTC